VPAREIQPPLQRRVCRRSQLLLSSLFRGVLIGVDKDWRADDSGARSSADFFPFLPPRKSDGAIHARRGRAAHDDLGQVGAICSRMLLSGSCTGSSKEAHRFDRETCTATQPGRTRVCLCSAWMSPSPWLALRTCSVDGARLPRRLSSPAAPR
jgi:hypothetical protein